MATLELRNLDADSLASVIALYPWFGGAHKELCRRIAAIGGKDWGDQQFADEALYVQDRRAIYNIMTAGRSRDLGDADLENLLRSYIKREAPQDAAAAGERPAAKPRERVTVVGGDFFSSDEYESVQAEKISLPKLAVATDPPSHDEVSVSIPPDDVFCTETMAEIYAEQGYFAEAEKIYSRLSLENPEKIAYFAALIEKLK